MSMGLLPSLIETFTKRATQGSANDASRSNKGMKLVRASLKAISEDIRGTKTFFLFKIK
jgi:hypothetical protein